MAINPLWKTNISMRIFWANRSVIKEGKVGNVYMLLENTIQD